MIKSTHIPGAIIKAFPALILLLLITINPAKAQNSASLSKAGAMLDTSAFSHRLSIQLEIDHPELVKQVNCRMKALSAPENMGNDSLQIELKYGSLFFKNKGRYVQLYGNTVIHHIDLNGDDYARIKSIEFSILNADGTESEKISVTLR